MTEFLAALLGALVGGMASLFVRRRDLVRSRRVEIYDDLLPPLLVYVSDPDWPARTRAQDEPDDFRALLEPVRRASHVIGGRDAKKVDKLYSLLVKTRRLGDNRTIELSDDGYGSQTEVWASDTAEKAYTAAHSEFLVAVGAFRDWLKGKLKHKL